MDRAQQRGAPLERARSSSPIAVVPPSPEGNATRPPERGNADPQASAHTLVHGGECGSPEVPDRRDMSSPLSPALFGPDKTSPASSASTSSATLSSVSVSDEAPDELDAATAKYNYDRVELHVALDGTPPTRPKPVPLERGGARHAERGSEEQGEGEQSLDNNAAANYCIDPSMLDKHDGAAASNYRFDEATVAPTEQSQVHTAVTQVSAVTARSSQSSSSSLGAVEVQTGARLSPQAPPTKLVLVDSVVVPLPHPFRAVSPVSTAPIVSPTGSSRSSGLSSFSPNSDEGVMLLPLPFLVLLLSDYLPWSQFLAMRAVSRSIHAITDTLCDSVWRAYSKRQFSRCEPVGDEWQIFFPNLMRGCYCALVLEMAKVLLWRPAPVVLDVPASNNRAAEQGICYTFPWFYVCKFLNLPIPVESCHNFDELRIVKSFVRFKSAAISMAYSQMYSVRDILENYGSSPNLMVSFITRMHPDEVPKFSGGDLPIRHSYGPIQDLCIVLPQVLTRHTFGRQVAFTLFVDRNGATHTYSIWYSRLNANQDVVELYEEQLNDYHNMSGYN